MKEKWLLLTGMLFLTISLTGCTNASPANGTGSEETVSDKEAEEKGILSKDDAEVLIYNRLSDKEKELYTVDFIKEEGTKYYIRTYETVNGETETKGKYTVDFNTEKVTQVE